MTRAEFNAPLENSPSSGFLATKNYFKPQLFYLLLLCFFITFFLSIDIGTALRTPHPLYNDRKGRAQGNSLLLTILSIFVLPRLTFVFCINTILFFSGFSKMATDVGSLAPGLDVHVVRLGDWTQGNTIFYVHSPFNCRFCRHCTTKHRCSFASSFLLTATDSFCATGLHSPPSLR
jgi:hypothetical protein